MVLDEREKEELAKKITEQRKSVWKGEVTPKRRAKKRQERKKAEQVPDRQQEHEEVEQIPEPHSGVVDDDSVEEHEEVKQSLDQPQERERNELAKKVMEQRRATWKGAAGAGSRTRRASENAERILRRHQEIERTQQKLEQQPDEPKVKKKRRNVQSRVPSLKLALLVMIGLIAAITIGVAIGYLAATHDLLKI